MTPGSEFVRRWGGDRYEVGDAAEDYVAIYDSEITSWIANRVVCYGFWDRLHIMSLDVGGHGAIGKKLRRIVPNRHGSKVGRRGEIKGSAEIDVCVIVLRQGGGGEKDE